MCSSLAVSPNVTWVETLTAQDRESGEECRRRYVRWKMAAAVGRVIYFGWLTSVLRACCSDAVVMRFASEVDLVEEVECLK